MRAPRPLGDRLLITCQLTKLETALDQIKKTYPKLAPADAAIVASALSLTGRHATALYEDGEYTWPADNQKLAQAMVPHVQIVQEAVEANAPKRAAKTAPEEEPIQINVGLKPNFAAAEALLGDRDDLKTLLSDILQEGVEFVYNPSDVGWQWALDRVNWSTVSNTDLHRRIKVKAAFTEGAVGVEQGTVTKKRPTKKAAEPVPAEPTEEPAEA